MTESGSGEAEPLQDLQSPRPLHLLSLGALAVAQPLLDVLSRGATFFVAHGIGASGLFVLVALMLLLPLPLILLVSVARRLHPPLGAAFHGIFIAGFVALIALPVLHRRLSGTTMPVVLAVLAGLLFATLYARRAAVRQFTGLLGLALALIPGAFFLAPQVRGMLRPAVTSERVVQFTRPGPVVVVIFDELALAALLDPEGRIDADRYPSFARLAATSTWFRNSVAASDHTEFALPAMLAGTLPEGPQLPTAREFPDNLCTLLEDEFEIRAREAITHLCPGGDESARDESSGIRNQAWRRLAGDLAVVYGHIVLPDTWRRRLPDISASWEGFGGSPDRAMPGLGAEPSSERELLRQALEALGRDRAAEFRAWVAGIRRGDRSSLHLIHSLLPHVPWQYTSSGKFYANTGIHVPGIEDERWGASEALVRLGRDRFVLQLGFVDRLIGELLDQLESEELLDEAIVVVTADHGVSFRPGDSRRRLSAGNRSDVLPIPLFVKSVGQREGRVNDEPVSAVQLLPTLLDLLGANGAPELEFSSLFASPEGRPRRLKQLDRRVVEVPEAALPIGSGPADTWTVGGPLAGGGHRDAELPLEWIGRRLDALERVHLLGERRLGAFSLDGEPLFRQVDLDARFLPVYLQGTLGEPLDISSVLAVAVNGMVAAVTRPYQQTGDMLRFAALLPESSLVEGANRIAVYRVLSTSAGRSVERLVGPDATNLRLVRDSDGRVTALGGADGSLPVADNEIEGYFSVDRRGDRLVVHGWAWNRAVDQPVRDLVVFHRDEAVSTGTPSEFRTDLRGPENAGERVRAGFRFDLPQSAVPELERTGLQVFARGESGLAEELGFFHQLRRASEESGDAEAGEAIRITDGRIIRIRERALRGTIDRVGRRPDGIVGLEVVGWAVDPSAGRPAETVLAFRGERCIYIGRPALDRPDVAASLADEALITSGFRLLLAEPDLTADDVRIFAVNAESVATELAVP